MYTNRLDKCKTRMSCKIRMGSRDLERKILKLNRDCTKLPALCKFRQVVVDSKALGCRDCKFAEGDLPLQIFQLVQPFGPLLHEYCKKSLEKVYKYALPVGLQECCDEAGGTFLMTCL